MVLVEGKWETTPHQTTKCRESETWWPSFGFPVEFKQKGYSTNTLIGLAECYIAERGAAHAPTSTEQTGGFLDSEQRQEPRFRSAMASLVRDRRLTVEGC